MKTALLLAALSALAPLNARAEAPAPAASSAGILRADFLRTLDDVEKKIVGLAESTPQDKYGFRPAAGVRSASEVFMHIGGANYFLPRFIGVKPPEGISREAEKTVTEKAKVIEFVKASFDHLRKHASALPEADYPKAIQLFGHDSTIQSALFLMANHLHEHLGQAIAYARMSGVTPPWSKAKE